MVQCSLRNDVLPATINRHPKEKAPVPFGQGLSLYLCSKFYILYRIHHIYTILPPMAKNLSRMGGIATQANLSADAILGFASAFDQDMIKR